ncbi:DUF3048 domain-containing protein [Modestobacter sp. VKM Ac-2978]|uniref:DUF3048 domain-containing protein n=1 Tax=Modestobacter sp. VKM Ac-2978 TaxID=3004132 RepID=UPI0022AAAF52|nr:DUF3048 domain-containing protein [Modestobacter sp. VKM Ac-2978]MCZ2849193.1 DUF3048 domain-containing protein [Modestobacter sp. VKM Ac-2978]
MTRSRSSADAGPAVGHRPRRRLAAALLMGVALTGVVACGSSAGTTPVAQSTPATTPPPPPPPPPPPVLWPLTGLESGPVDPRPALAVKVENSSDARPQTGLGAADLVWEQVVEGGIPRYVAVYHSNLPAQIGPIRSVRPMDPAIAAPLHGLFAFSGGQAGYVDAIAAAGMQVLSNDAGADGFFRTSDRPAPHNVHADPLRLLAQADPAHQAAPPPQFDLAATAEEATAATAGTPATNLALTLSRISRPQWTWSPPDARWLRTEGSTPAVGADGSRLSATNVVVLRVDVLATAARDPAGNPVPETVLVGEGEALVATGGKTVAATWVKTGVGERVVLRGADGHPVRLAPGNTWVELVPNSGGAVAVG